MKEHRRSSSEKRKGSSQAHESQHIAHSRHNNMNEQPWWKSGRGIAVMVIVIVVVLVAISAALWFFVRKPAVVSTQIQTQTGNPVVTVPQNQLPAMFPPNIPLEAGATVTSNFNAAAANGQFQATRSFQSVKSVAANFAIYDNFLTSPVATASGWKIISTTNTPSDPNHASLFAKNANGLLTIDIASLPPQPFPATQVTITYITNPPSAPAVTSSSVPGQ